MESSGVVPKTYGDLWKYEPVIGMSTVSNALIALLFGILLSYTKSDVLSKIYTGIIIECVIHFLMAHIWSVGVYRNWSMLKQPFIFFLGAEVGLLVLIEISGIFELGMRIIYGDPKDTTDFLSLWVWILIVVLDPIEICYLMAKLNMIYATEAEHQKSSYDLVKLNETHRGQSVYFDALTTGNSPNSASNSDAAINSNIV